MNFDFELLIPIFVCVVLPVCIVWLVMHTKQQETNKKAEVMLKAIESGATLDPSFFKGEEKKQKTIKETLLARLTGACVTGLLGVVFLIGGLVFGWTFDFFPASLPLLGGILLAIGIALLVVYFIGKSMLAKEIEAEENALTKQ